MTHHDQPVDPREAEEVVRLASSHHRLADDGPTVAGLAEALNLSTEEVERLLAQVRQRSNPVPPREDRIAHRVDRQFGDRSAAISAVIALFIVVILAGGAFYYFGIRQGRIGAGSDDPALVIGSPTAPAPPVAPDAPAKDVTVVGEDGSKVTIHSSGDGSNVTIHNEAPKESSTGR